jgi:hypothetical protein
MRQKEIFERGEVFSTYKVYIDGIRETGNFAFFAPFWIVQNYRSIINDHNTFCLLNDDDFVSGTKR